MSEPFLGQIQTFAFNFAPRGWMLCDGQLLAIQQNTALFSLIGTTYGGNGTTTFALPDLRGRMMVHQGSGPGLPTVVMGESAGNTQQTLLISNMPAHNHMLNASTTAADGSTPANTFLALANGADNLGNPLTVQIYGPAPAAPANTTMNPGAIGMTGGSLPFSIMPPFLVINICIAVQGIFPSRN
jgi:microcystin-dependent protein